MNRSPILLVFLLASMAVSAQSPGIWKQTGVRTKQTDLNAMQARCLPHCSFTGHADADGMKFRYSYLGSDGKTHVHAGHVRFGWSSAQGPGSLIPGEAVQVTAEVSNTADIGYVSGYALAGRAGFMKPRPGSSAEAAAHGSAIMEGSFVAPSGPGMRPDGSLILDWEVSFVLSGGNETRHVERVVTYTWQPVTGQTGQAGTTTASDAGAGTQPGGAGVPTGAAGVQAGGPTVRTLQSEYRVGEPITVQFNGISGYPKDWVGLYGAQAYHANEYIEWKYTDGRKDGTLTFSSPRYGAGTYKIRVYENDGYKILAESAEFRVVN